MSNKIKEALQVRGITHAELAQQVGVSDAMISYIVKGYKEPSVKLLKRIADYLGMKVDDLI